MRWSMTGLGMTLSLALISAAFGQAAPAASVPGIGQGLAPAKSVAANKIVPPPASPALMPVLTDEAKDRWWISETIAQSRKDQPVFFGVRLANAPQAALAETYSQSYTAGETLAVRLWGCNDLPKEFKGRVQVALKRGDKQFQSREETVRLAPETVKRLAKYSFDTAELAAGQYALETSLFDNAGKLVQQQVTMLMVHVPQNQEDRRQAKAVEKAKKEAELKAQADLSRRNALAKEEARQKAVDEAKAELKAKQNAEKKAAAELKAQAKAAEKAKKEVDLSRRSALAKAELKAKADMEKQVAEAAAAKKAAEQKLFEDTKSKYMAQEKSVVAVKVQALVQQETECQARVTQSEADQQVAESQAAALALEAKTAQADADAKEAEETRAKQMAKQDAPKDVKAKRAVEAKAAEVAREQADLSRRSALAKADAARRIAENKAEATSDAKASLVKQQKSMTRQKADLEAQSVKNAERKAKDEIKANQVAAQAKHDAELKAKQDAEKKAAADLKAQAKAAEKAKKEADLKAKADFEKQAAEAEAAKKAELKVKADLSRRSALAKREAEKKAAAELKAQAKAAEKVKKEAELKAKADMEKQSAEAEAAKKAADHKLFEDTKSKYMVQEKAAIAVKAAAMSQQETECQAKVALAVADQQVAESQAAALALEAKTAQADLNAKGAEVTRAKKAAKPAAEAQVVGEVQGKVVAEVKAKYLAQEKAAIAVKVQALAQQEAEYQAKVTLAEADQQTAEAQAAALALEAKTTQANLDTATTLEKRMKQMAKQDAPKDVKAKRAAEAKAAEAAREQANLSRRSALAKADAARRLAEDKAEATSDAKAALVKQRKSMAEQKADLETEAVKNAERQAKDEIRAKQIAEKKIAEDMQAAEKARRDAALTIMVMDEKKAAAWAEQKSRQADAARRLAKDKAEATSDAKAMLVKQRKSMAEQNAAMEAQADKNAERQAKDEIRANQVAEKARLEAESKVRAEARQKAREEAKTKQAEEAKVAREAKVKARIEARTGLTVRQPTDQPATDVHAEAGKPVAVTSKDIEKEKWRVAASLLYRRIGGRNFKTGSYSARYAISQKSISDHWTGPAGGMNDAGNRTYDDGYVMSDDYSELDSGTWNWGYDNGQQVNGNSVEFKGVDRVWREYSRRTTVTEAENFDNADYSGGLMVEVERYIAQTRFVDYGLSLGLSRAQTFGTAVAGMNTFNDNQWWGTYNDRVVDAYDITGLGITPDSVPYKGNATDEGPVINTSPMTRRGLGAEMVSEGTYRAYNSIYESLDMDLSTLSLGMSVKGNYRRVYVVGSTGPTLNMIEKDATYEETLFESSNGGSPQVLKYWSDSSSGTECLFGYYVQAEVGVRIYRELHLGVFGRYDWLENVSGNVGPASYEINPAGGSMGGTLGLNF
ncbi:MAG: hypothetical protein KJ692_00785 [Verrucomicrobia bacterium]|nr:hypothetical protein [Verrucomicrobiota bacterium]